MNSTDKLRETKGRILPVVGAFFGDEGKAKVVDCLADKFDYVVRYQGGDNAGHSVYVEGEKRVFHIVPCGILRSRAIISHGVVLNPESLISEINELPKEYHSRLFVAENVQIICDWHIAFDHLLELARGSDKIGTTGKGIGPAYSTKALRLGLRAVDLLDKESLRTKIQLNLNVLNPLFEIYDMPKYDLEECVEKYHGLGLKLKPYLINFFPFIHGELAEGKNFLFEGSQGLLLDIDLGTYPYVTSSNIVGSLVSGTGLSPNSFDRVMGVVKAYSTRVGNGEFVTEIFGDQANYIRDKGNEYGATTGRPRRIGWLDLVAIKYSLTFSGATEIALTLVDVLDGIEGDIKVCVGYEDENGKSVGFAGTNLLNVKPVYRTFRSWKEDYGSIGKFEDFSENFREFVRFIEEYLGIKIAMISYGKNRSEVLEL